MTYRTATWLDVRRISFVLTLSTALIVGCGSPRSVSPTTVPATRSAASTPTAGLATTKPAAPAATPAPASGAAPKPAAAAGGRTYTVKDRDNLATIAEDLYGDPKLWRTIYLANEQVIGPNAEADLKPGTVLQIPPKP
jgi:nucleoid-associated protein YgaU